jgi:hypothetical protein
MGIASPSESIENLVTHRTRLPAVLISRVALPCRSNRAYRNRPIFACNLAG